MNEKAPETALRATETGDGADPDGVMAMQTYDAHERADAAENGPTRDYCPRWPTVEVDGEGHAFESHKPADSPVWIRRCSFCGWIDGAEIAADLREAGWVDPEEAARLRQDVRILEGSEAHEIVRLEYEMHQASSDNGRLMRERDELAAAVSTLASENDRLGDLLSETRANADGWYKAAAEAERKLATALRAVGAAKTILVDALDTREQP